MQMSLLQSVEILANCIQLWKKNLKVSVKNIQQKDLAERCSEQEPTVIMRFFLFQNDQLKPCILRTIAVRPRCGAHMGIVRCSYDVATGL